MLGTFTIQSHKVFEVDTTKYKCIWKTWPQCGKNMKILQKKISDWTVTISNVKTSSGMRWTARGAQLEKFQKILLFFSDLFPYYVY